ncbi:hypothetical protein O2W15_08645 [Modestobacter sp. VKM Ac-2979]|uniref:hypothetical protein n=1 Tax=unclassified Modestobacter TaxID=2643866 RepID=UPI0022AB92A0|nr:MULTISPECIES: hypothetical protein [unclassified Modestobacter]MCZ2811504.1 hypothetical protein [Modestobacter sp. VKM Ac-2979]MCZ2841018.1 hypothetical protein [Modestobacter sp. VKM Ac-2980]
MVHRAAPSPGARALVVVSLVGVLGLAVWLAPRVWETSGSLGFLLFGPPVVCSALALWVERARGTVLAPAVVAALGVVSVAWALLTLLGGGLYLLVPALLLLVAAMVSWVDRRPDRSTPARD